MAISSHRNAPSCGSPSRIIRISNATTPATPAACAEIFHLKFISRFIAPATAPPPKNITSHIGAPLYHMNTPAAARHNIEIIYGITRSLRPLSPTSVTSPMRFNSRTSNAGTATVNARVTSVNTSFTEYGVKSRIDRLNASKTPYTGISNGTSAQERNVAEPSAKRSLAEGRELTSGSFFFSSLLSFSSVRSFWGSTVISSFSSTSSSRSDSG